MENSRNKCDIRGVLKTNRHNKDRPLKLFGLIITTCLFLALLVSHCSAITVMQYKINDSESGIDTANTTAVLDTVLHDVRLPIATMGKTAGFWDESLNYAVLAGTRFVQLTFNGTSMVENTVCSKDGLINPVSAFVSSPYPDVVVATPTETTHYSFTGTGMEENPVLQVAGLTSVVSVGSRNNDVGVLDSTDLKYFGSTGSEMSQIPELSITGSLNNPIDFTLFSDSYDCAILEPGKVRFFYFTGDGMAEAPSVTITGLSKAVTSISSNERNITIVESNTAKTYLYDGSGYSYAAALSVTSGLIAPRCIALRPGSNDMLIVDGGEAKYYSFNGTCMEYNADLSAIVTGLQGSIRYASSAAAQSVVFTSAYNVSVLRAMAYSITPDNTSITWSYSTDGGESWIKRWRVRGLESSSICEKTGDNGTSWVSLGVGSVSFPSAGNSALWGSLPAGNKLCWKADLTTSDTTTTPHIQVVSPGVPGTTAAIVLESDAIPDATFTDIPDGCYLTAAPQFNWNFTDSDAGDYQSAYQITVRRQDTNNIIYDSGKIPSANKYFVFPTSTAPGTPGIFWNTGQYQFIIQLVVYDSADQPSTIKQKNFCVVAFEKPRIKEISVAPTGQTSPDPNIPSTHLVISSGMTGDELPETKAGGKVTLLIDTIGPVNSIVSSFPYMSTQATIGKTPTSVNSLGTNKQWEIEFWTDADKTICPDGTVIQANFSGTGSSGNPVLNLPPYAAGLVKTAGSVFENWMVVLQGRKTS